MGTAPLKNRNKKKLQKGAKLCKNMQKVTAH